MAFFGVTQLGYQDTIRSHVREPPTTPQSVYRSGSYRDQAYSDLLPPTSEEPKAQNSGQQVSYKEYNRLKHKHIRDPIEKTDVYHRPVTTSQDVAQWRRDEPLKEREPWTHVKRHVVTNSKMTKFVQEMSLTNREFSLY